MSPEHPEIAELAAARVVQGLLDDRPEAELIEIVSALISWAMVLLRDAKPEVRVEAAQLLFANAVWLAPSEKFDADAVRIVRDFARSRNGSC
jgi:hypothetical protein